MNSSRNAFKTDLSWNDVEFCRKTSGLPVIVKGITTAEDAVNAVKAGGSVIQVSNHGGRAGLHAGSHHCPAEDRRRAERFADQEKQAA